MCALHFRRFSLAVLFFFIFFFFSYFFLSFWLIVSLLCRHCDYVITIARACYILQYTRSREHPCNKLHAIKNCSVNTRTQTHSTQIFSFCVFSSGSFILLFENLSENFDARENSFLIRSVKKKLGRNWIKFLGRKRQLWHAAWKFPNIFFSLHNRMQPIAIIRLLITMPKFFAE